MAYPLFSYHSYYYPYDLYYPYQFLFIYSSVFIVLAIHFTLKWYTNKVSAQKKKIISKYIVFSLPLTVPLTILLFGRSFYSLVSGNFSFFNWVVSLVTFYFFAKGCFIIAVFPAEIANFIVVSLSDSSFQKQKTKILTLWYVLESLKRKRLILFLILISFLLLTLAGNILLISSFAKKYLEIPFENSHLLFSLLVISIIFLVIYVALEFIKYGKPNIPTVKNHEKIKDLKRTIENLSITTGVEMPNFRVLAYNNPTIFSTHPNFEKPTIYITAPLLQMANKSELEALVAHEFAAIYSGRILYFKRVHNLLIILRAFTFLLFLLFLINIDIFLIFIWLLLLVHITFNLTEYPTPNKSSLEISLRLLNPPLWLINILSYLIFYSVGYVEEFYTDIKTIEFTRYPRAIFSILEKLKKYNGPRQRLPARFKYLYFTSEGALFDRLQMQHPFIYQRELEIEKTSPSLKPLSDQKIKCPQCDSLMKEFKFQSFYGYVVNGYYCEKCDSFWFDGFNLWYVNPESPKLNRLRSQKININKFTKNASLFCPRCGILLKLIKDPHFPEKIKIWSCPICSGSWTSRDNLLHYLSYRKLLLKKTKKPSLRLAFDLLHFLKEKV